MFNYYVHIDKESDYPFIFRFGTDNDNVRRLHRLNINERKWDYFAINGNTVNSSNGITECKLDKQGTSLQGTLIMAAKNPQESMMLTLKAEPTNDTPQIDETWELKFFTPTKELQQILDTVSVETSTETSLHKLFNLAYHSLRTVNLFTTQDSDINEDTSENSTSIESHQPAAPQYKYFTYEENQTKEIIPFRFAYNTERLERFNASKTVWEHFVITSLDVTSEGLEYTFDSQSTKLQISLVTHCHANDKLFRLRFKDNRINIQEEWKLTPTNSTMENYASLPVVPITINELNFTGLDGEKNAYSKLLPQRIPTNRKSRGSIPQQFFADKDKKYTLSDVQRTGLKKHLDYLQKRETEYANIFSYIVSYLNFYISACLHFPIFISSGISKFDKIFEIERLLDFGIGNAEVLEQGHTGSILSR